MSSPTQRALKYLRDDLKYLAQVVERWNQWAHVRQDLFGFIDIVACGDGAIWGIQCTSGTNHAARRTKIMSEDKALRWLHAGGKIMIVSFRKNSKGRYEMRREDLTKEDLFKP